MKNGSVLLFLCLCVWIGNAVVIWHPAHFA